MAGKLRRWLAAFGLLGCLTAHAGSPVWAIRGAHNTVYLAGSVHLLKADAAKLPAAFDRAYADSEALVMELDLDDVDVLGAGAWMLEHGMLEEGTTLEEHIGAERHRRVAAAAEQLGVPGEMLERMKPWAVGVQLLQMQYVQLGYDPTQGVELQLVQRAQTDGKEIRGLETLPEQFGAFDTLSREDQARFLDLVVGEMHEMEGETQQLVSAWRSGDTGKLAAGLVDEYKRFPTLYRALVRDRNKRWVPQIEKLFNERQDYFVVVGALHLVGEDGLLELLRKAGREAAAVN